MATASIKFVRTIDKVRLALVVDDMLVAEGDNVTSIVREIIARGLTKLRLSDTFYVELPTDSDTLAEAARQTLDEPLAVFILIHECSW